MGNNRRGFIGGSDIAAVMGLSRWKGPLTLWGEKTGNIAEKDLSDVEAVQMGIRLEPMVAELFTEKTGIKLRVDRRDFKHKKYPFMACHIDRWVVGADALFEAKTCSAWKEREWAGEDIPIEYVLQLNWELGIVGKNTGYIAVLVGGQKFRWKAIEFDKGLYEKQVESARHFWTEFVEKNVMPIPNALDNEALSFMYPKSNEEVVTFEGDDALEVDGLIEARLGGIESKKEIDAELEEIEAQLKAKLGENEGGETARYKYTWKTIEKKAYEVPAQSYRQLRTTDKNTKLKKEAA